MSYLVIEIQKTDDNVANIVNKRDDYQHAKSTFYQILASAAISEVHVHSAVILSDEGEFIQKETFYHLPEPEPEPEPEPDPGLGEGTDNPE